MASSVVELSSRMSAGAGEVEALSEGSDPFRVAVSDPGFEIEDDTVSGREGGAGGDDELSSQIHVVGREVEVVIEGSQPSRVAITNTNEDISSKLGLTEDAIGSPELVTVSGIVGGKEKDGTLAISVEDGESVRARVARAGPDVRVEDGAADGSVGSPELVAGGGSEGDEVKDTLECEEVVGVAGCVSGVNVNEKASARSVVEDGGS